MLRKGMGVPQSRVGSVLLRPLPGRSFPSARIDWPWNLPRSGRPVGASSRVAGVRFQANLTKPRDVCNWPAAVVVAFVNLLHS